MRLRYFVILAALAIIASSAFLYLLLGRSDALQVIEVPVRLRISDYVGFNLDSDALNLGTVPSGGRASRNLTVANDYPYDILVHIDVEGRMSGWLFASDNDFILHPGGKRSIGFIAAPQKDLDLGDYEGQVYITISRVG